MQEINTGEVNTIGSMLAEELDVIRSRIKIIIAEYEIRTGKKVEHREIAALVGVTQQQFSAWVNDRGWPRMDKAYKLAKLLGCKVDDLYIYEEE